MIKIAVRGTIIFLVESTVLCNILKRRTVLVLVNHGYAYLFRSSTSFDTTRSAASLLPSRDIN